MINQADLTRWFEAHAAPLVLYARQWLDRGRAEDVVQEIFVRLLMSSSPPANPKAWLYRAARNEAIAQWRSSRRRHQRERSAALPEALFEPWGASEELDAIVRALDVLPPAEREMLVLRIWGELTLAEVSELLAMPRSTVFQRYKTALGALRKKMDPCRKTSP